MFKLALHPDAQLDLESLWTTDQTAASRIVTVLQEIKGDQKLLAALTDHEYGAHGSEKIHVMKWLEHWNKGKNIWRLKLWELEKSGTRFRIVYSYDPGSYCYCVLGIVPRDFNYDSKSPFTQRILAAYNAL